MPAKNLPLSTEPRLPTDYDVNLLHNIAEDAGDAEVVRLCDAAMRNYASARASVGVEIDKGRHAQAFRAVLIRQGKECRRAKLREVLRDPSSYPMDASVYARDEAHPPELDDEVIVFAPEMTRPHEFGGTTVVMSVYGIVRVIEELEEERGRRAPVAQRYRALIETVEAEENGFI